MKGLLSKKNIDNEALKNRDKKREMFVRVITLLEVMTKKDLGIDVDNILAGKEAEKTNLMLQIIGRLAAKQDISASNTKYVQAALKKLKSGNEKEVEEPKNDEPKIEKPKKSKSKEKPVEKEPSEEVAPQRPKSARQRSKSRINQADDDEIEIDEERPMARPVTSRGNRVGEIPPEDNIEARPKTRSGRAPEQPELTREKTFHDPFLVQTRIDDDNSNEIRNFDENAGHGQLVQEMLKIRDDSQVSCFMQ